jgi:hypothetical protein
MGSYLPLFSVEVEHTYFSEGLCAGLDFVPTPDSRMFIEKTGLLIRHTQNGVRIFFDQNSSEALRLCATDSDEPMRLAFKVFARQRFFRAYTELKTSVEDAILYFDNQGGKIDATNRLRLHDADYVTARNFEKLNSPKIADILSRKDRLLKPEFIVSIRFGEKEIRILDAASKTAYQKYYLKFQARETFWKYYLLGSMTKKKSYIADLDNVTEFEDTGQTSLPGNRIALTFRSKKRIPLREDSEFRFQLKEKDPNGGKVLIKRMPVASAAQFYREIIDGNEAIVSEIFINC